ncbi:MAG: Flp pilus assembly complex ATPase component TadA [Thermoleophilia bacterium]|nr:Flp pilus assembly complex ATPase component TadA [Thermoleophilia bacterium]
MLRLGELLVRAGHATQEHVDQALELQPVLRRRLGEILVEKRWATPRAIAEALAEQYGLDFVDLAQTAVDASAAGLLQEGFAIGHQALPVRYVDEHHVQVAVADPTNLRTTDELRLALGLGFTLAVASADALESTIQRAYRLTVAVSDRAPEFEQVDDESVADGALDLVNDLIGRAVNSGASDIHLNPQPREVLVRFRVDGVLRDEPPIDKRLQNATAARVKVMAQLDIAEKRMPQDGSFVVYIAGNPVDVRAAVLPTKHGEQVVLRVLRRESKLELPRLGMSPEMEAVFTHAIEQPHGAVISCGPTGSGKTTTLYAALDRLNDGLRSIATIEDPVEYQLPGVMQMEVHGKINLTFGRGLRTILRADPEVILVGEIRDEETAKIAIQAAMTGHLVLTTLHTNDAASAIARMRTLGVDPDLLAGSINCIVSQRLARRLCMHCREPYEPTQEQAMSMNLISAGANPTLYRAAGCLQCGNTGYSGRVALYELMPVHGLGRVLLDGSTDEIFDAAVAAGMRTLREDGIRQSLAGVTTLEEVRRITGDRRLLA